MGWFAPVGVKSRYLLAFCYLSIALALLYYFGTVVSAYFTGTCEGARACTTSIPVPYSPMYLTGTGIRRTGTGIRRTGICRSLTAAPEVLGEGIFLA